MFVLKLLLRRPGYTLLQMVNRLTEKQRNYNYKKVVEPQAEGGQIRSKSVPLLDRFKDNSVCYEKYSCKQFDIGIRMGDNVCLTHTGEIVNVKNILLVDNSTYVLVYKKVNIIGPLYTDPINSSRYHMYHVEDIEKSQTLFAMNVKEIAYKCVIGEHKLGYYCNRMLPKYIK
jgi:hypothetical protein